MTKILVVDDNATNRRLVTTLLGFEGYETLEAPDGAEGLRIALAERPRLVISDILMPTMDGYEFVRRLRQEPDLIGTSVIFYTANYHEREAYALAEKCAVERVIVKPCDSAEFLCIVRATLTGAPGPKAATVADPEFDIAHLRLLTDKLSRTANDLKAANGRLTALIDLNVQLASERDPHVLLEKVCAGARSLVAARCAILAVVDRVGSGTVFSTTSGLELPITPTSLRIDVGLLGRVMTLRRPARTRDAGSALSDVGFPAPSPPVKAIVAAPICSLTRSYGWLCLADKIGTDTFTVEDERLLNILGAQVGRIYENDSLYLDVQHQAAQLLVEIDERKLAENRVVLLNRTYAMLSGVNSLIVRATDRSALLRDACKLARDPGHFRIAWCGMRRSDDEELETAAWSGDSAEIAEALRPPAKAAADNPVVAAMNTRQPVICNDLRAENCGVPSRALLLQHGYHALVALPLIVGDKAAGCLVLVTDESDFFDDDEIRLLNELSGDIGFALDHIENADRLNYLARYDVLTGLANRTLLQERLAQHVSAGQQTQTPFAVVIADPERFSSLNDTLGRAVADQLLRAAASRFAECVGTPELVARIGATQFAAVLPGRSDAAEVSRAVESLWHSWLGQPFDAGGQAITLTARAGIATFPADGADAETLLRNAEAALTNAKSSGKTIAAYTARLSEQLSERLSLEKNLRRALENEEFVLHYQPKVDLDTRRVQGVEALIRWQNPDLGLVPPGKFIKLIEENGMIADVGAWALRQASGDRSRWIEQGLAAPRVAVNVSTIQLRREDFVRTVSTLVRLAGSEAGIDIEVTESLLMDDVSDNIAKLAAIRELGVKIALDDFGTGYSSLSYLTRLPVQTLKIDRSFISAMLDDPGAMTLVSTILSLARALKLETVAEGVESEDQARILRLLKCDQMQGYLISKPLPFDDMTAFLSRKRT